MEDSEEEVVQIKKTRRAQARLHHRERRPQQSPRSEKMDNRI